jgi:hypothetical protein
MPFGKGAGITAPWLVPRHWQQNCAGRPLYFSGGESATLVWNAKLALFVVGCLLQSRMQTVIPRSGWVKHIASNCYIITKFNLINGVAYLPVPLMQADFAPTLHDRSMRTQSLTAFVFHQSGVNLMCRYGSFLLVPRGIIDYRSSQARSPGVVIAVGRSGRQPHGTRGWEKNTRNRTKPFPPR